jgi:hypothetical protein
MAAPAAAHATGEAVDRSARRPSGIPGTAASASTGGFRHRISGVGTGAIVIASTSTLARVRSASIFRKTWPTRTATRSLLARTTSTCSTSGIFAAEHPRSPCDISAPRRKTATDATKSVVRGPGRNSGRALRRPRSSIKRRYSRTPGE